MMKKRLFSTILAGCMILSLAGCGRLGNKGNQVTSQSTENASGSGAESLVLKDGTYEGEGAGNNGPIKAAVTISGGAITDIAILDHQETPGLGDTAMETIISQILEYNSSNVDAISSATKSSDGLIMAVENALRAAGATDAMLENQAAAGKSDKLEKTEFTYDVVVVGAGGAGLSAAVEAAASGAKVAVLEKTPFSGGNTLVSGGGLNIPVSPLQKEQGIEDSVEQFIEDTMNGGDLVNDKALVTTMAEGALETYQWLADDIQVEFMPDRLQQFGGHSVPRAIIPAGNKGTEIIRKLEARAKELGVDFYMETKANSLIQETDRITGVKAQYQGEELTFHTEMGVILSTGGFGANVEMREKYNPDYGKQYQTTCTSASTGDGILMAEEAGAKLIDMEYIQVYPTCNPETGIISYVANSRFDGALLFNQEGNRFVNEMGRRDVISNAIITQPEGYAYLIWGQEVESVGTMTQVHKKEYEEMLKQGVIYQAKTLKEAAEYANIDADVLLKNIERYNQDVQKGADEEFKKGGNLVKIEEGPFYIQKVVPSTHHTMGGIKINTDAQVLNEKGEIIPKLYAAGEVVGGVHGTNRLGGNAITDIMVFGRIAGQNVIK